MAPAPPSHHATEYQADGPAGNCGWIAGSSGVPTSKKAGLARVTPSMRSTPAPPTDSGAISMGRSWPRESSIEDWR